MRTVSISSLERNQGKGNNPQDRFSPVETPTIEDAAAPPNKFAPDWADWSIEDLDVNRLLEERSYGGRENAGDTGGPSR